MKTDRSLEILNAAKDHVVRIANEEGIDLQAEFGTVGKFQEFVFALVFKTAVDLGVPTNEAFDLVAGQGAYDQLVTDVWNHANG